MTRFVAWLVVSALLLGSGCTVSHQIARPSTIEELGTRAAAAAVDRKVAILYPAVRPIAAGAPPASQRFPTFTSPLESLSPAGVTVRQPGGSTLLGLSEVRGYEVKRRGRGAIEGAAAGLVLGALVGAAIGFSAGDDPAPTPSPPCMSDTPFGCGFEVVPTRRSANEKAMLGAGMGGVTTAVLGAIMGAAIGHTDRFVF